MRATIDLPDNYRAAVLAIAARKGYRGYSKVIIEALEFYLAEKEAKESGVGSILAMKGSWSSRETSKVRNRIKEVRENYSAAGK